MKNLIFDSDAVFQMIKHTELSNLTTDGLEVGIIFGFVRQIMVIGMNYLPNNIIFCWDSRNNLRKKLSPVYKANRVPDETAPEITAAIYKQKHILESILPELGFVNHFSIEGYESDDLIASLVLNGNPNDEWIIATHDNDLYQLLTDKVSIWNIKKKAPYTSTMFIKEFGIKPDKWAQVKALAGCSSDNVIGIPNVGVVTAIKSITHNISPSAKIYKVIQEPINQALVDDNYKLVKLPLAGTPVLTIEKDKLDFTKLMEFLEKFSFRSLTDERSVEKWRILCNHINAWR